MNHYDLIIIGGGMVGASLACALRGTALRIALIDAAPCQVDDPRLIALNYSSYCLFDNLGVWPAMAAHAAAINEVHVSDQGRFGATRLRAQDVNLATLGYVVPAHFINAALDAALAESTAQSKATIHLFRPATLQDLSQTETGVTLTVQTPTETLTLTGSSVIGADGSHSTVRQALGFTSDMVDYGQSAVVTVTTLQRSHHHIAYERFHASGAIAMLPLTGNRVATIWTDNTATIQQLLSLDETAFITELQRGFGYRLGRIVSVGKRYTFPLQGLTATEIHKQRVLLIGNAAHTLHPIAAQGLNLALAEIAKLAELVCDNPADVTWQAYLAWQQQRESISTTLSHQLPRVFSSSFSLVQWLRQMGLIGLDVTPPLKRHFIRRALGHTADMPRLLIKKM